MAVIAIPRFLGPVPLSVVVRERHESTLAITRNPIETGADVTDHAYVEPKRLELEAVTADGALSEVAIAASYEALLALQEAREPFDVVTGLHLYRDMQVERIEVDRDKRYARVLYFRASLIEINIVDTETTSGSGPDSANGQGSKGTQQSGLKKNSLEKGATSDRGSPTVQRGNTATQPAPTTGSSPEAVRNRSIATEIFGI